MFNKVVLVGRMTRDPELRRTGTGKAVASFTIALNRKFASPNGQVLADFIPCVVWNKMAENVDKYCSKGSLVGVSGRLQSRSYENSKGQKVFVVEAVCEDIRFLDTKKKGTTDVVQEDHPDNFNGKDILDNIDKEYLDSFNSFDIIEDDMQF